MIKHHPRPIAFANANCCSAMHHCSAIALTCYGAPFVCLWEPGLRVLLAKGRRTAERDCVIIPARSISADGGEPAIVFALR